MKRFMLVLIAGILTMAMASLSAAQDMKQDMKKEKKEMQDTMEMKKEGMGMASFSCAPACGFKVQSPDGEEVKAMAKTHAKKHHGKDLSDEDMKKMMKWEGKDMKEMKMKKEGHME